MKQEYGKPMSLSYVMDTSYPDAPLSPQSSTSSDSPCSYSGDGLTLIERRQRNKTASAKYRQKKNRQQSEMKRMIHQLTEQDVLMKRQVQELKMENQRLKSMNDHLRGKIMAKKMLDQYFERHHLPTPPCFDPESLDSF